MGTGTTAMTLANLITALGSVFTALIGYIPNIFGVVLNSVVVQLFLGVTLTGIIIRYGRSLLSVK